jgi:hypothetical protein
VLNVGNQFRVSIPILELLIRHHLDFTPNSLILSLLTRKMRKTPNGNTRFDLLKLMLRLGADIEKCFLMCRNESQREFEIYKYGEIESIFSHLEKTGKLNLSTLLCGTSAASKVDERIISIYNSSRTDKKYEFLFSIQENSGVVIKRVKGYLDTISSILLSETRLPTVLSNIIVSNL